MIKSIMRFKVNNLNGTLSHLEAKGDISTLIYLGIDNSVFGPNRAVKFVKVINVPSTEIESLNWFNMLAVTFEDGTEELHLTTNITKEHINLLHLDMLSEINVNTTIRDIARTIEEAWGTNVGYYKWLKFIPTLKRVSSDTPWDIVADFDRFEVLYNFYRDTHQNEAKEAFISLYKTILQTEE